MLHEEVDTGVIPEIACLRRRMATSREPRRNLHHSFVKYKKIFPITAVMIKTPCYCNSGSSLPAALATKERLASMVPGQI